jgi:UDP-GlcNAc:undecaprenyl-phosphate GlcNAc-1-phosphate transferase
MNVFLHSLPVVLAGAYIAFIIFGVYRGVWRYVGVDELIRFGWASIGAMALVSPALLIIFSLSVIPPATIFLLAVFLFLGLAASRGSFRILDRVYGRQQAVIVPANVLIYGAEDAGEIALRWILQNPELGYRPVGFLDDDQYKWGRRIHGVDVLGGRGEIEAILEVRKIAGVIITSHQKITDGNVEGLISTCRKKGVWIRVLHLDFELMD